jgi:hypothetical protein
MWADSLDELLAMADAIGVQRKWLQRPPKASWVHFDVSLGMKTKALRRGAVLTDKFGPVEHCAKLDVASGDPGRVAYGQTKLAGVALCRAKSAHAPAEDNSEA